MRAKKLLTWVVLRVAIRVDLFAQRRAAVH